MRRATPSCRAYESLRDVATATAAEHRGEAVGSSALPAVGALTRGLPGRHIDSGLPASSVADDRREHHAVDYLDLADARRVYPQRIAGV